MRLSFARQEPDRIGVLVDLVPTDPVEQGDVGDEVGFDRSDPEAPVHGGSLRST